MTGLYDRWTTPALWSMLADEKESDAAVHLRAWDEKQQLLDDQLALLRTQRDELAQHWNPDHSPAAKTFIDTVDGLMQAIANAGTSVAGVRQTYRHVTDAIRDARREMEPLHARYNDHQAARASDPLADWVPDSWVPDTPNVMSQYHRRVDAEARAVMERMDARVAEAMAHAVDILPLQRMDQGDGLTLPRGVGPGGSTSRSGGGTAGFGGVGPQIQQPPFAPPPPAPAPDVQNGSPVLTGGAPPFVAQTGTPPVITPPMAGPSASVAPPVASRVQRFPAPEVPAFNGLIGAQPVQKEVPPASRPMAPTNGIIGGPPMTPTGGARQASRRPTGSGQPAASAAARSTPGGWHDRSYEEYTRRRAARTTDPDTQWPVKEGVPPLIEAPADPGPHDAPPGVIGLDR